MAPNTARWVIEFTWSMVGFTFLLILLRCSVRTSRRSQSDFDIALRNITKFLKLSDIFAVLAWFSFILYSVTATVLWKGGFFTIPSGPFSKEQVLYLSTDALKWYFVQDVTYLNCMFAVKFAFLSVYNEWLPKDRSRFIRWGLIFLWALTAVSWALNAFGTIFLCIPISRNWTHKPEDWCSANDNFAMSAVVYMMHILSDFLIYVFPLPTVFALAFKSRTLSMRQKIGLGLSFSSGFFSMVVGIMTLVWGATERSSSTRSKEIQYVLFACEHTASLMALSGPAVVGTIVRVWSRMKKSWVPLRYGRTDRPREDASQSVGAASTEKSKTDIGVENTAEIV